MIRTLASFSALLLFAASSAAAPKPFDITLTGGKSDATNILVAVPVSSELVGENPTGIEVLTADKKPILAQLTKPRLLAAVTTGMELHLLIPELKAGQTVALTATASNAEKPKDSFVWKEAESLPQLEFNDRPVLRYFHKAFDPKATPPKMATGNPTTKPYHQLFDPTGKKIVTNGAQGQYPHHRGIYYGFNRISYDGKTADIWHCPKGERTAHEKILATETGPLLGRHTLQIGWHGQDGKIFANERRELTAYNLPGGTLIEFASELTTPLDKVRLDGDPQHAGFHFRAASSVEKKEIAKETVFIRPDGKGKPGEELNWDPKTKKGPINLPWDAMSFLLDDERFTVVYVDHPNNPKDARQSERSYGRIGTYFEYDLTKDKPLKVQYRLWFQAGEPTIEQCAAISGNFVEPPASKTAAR